MRAVRSQAAWHRRARSDAPYQPDKMRIAEGSPNGCVLVWSPLLLTWWPGPFSWRAPSSAAPGFGVVGMVNLIALPELARKERFSRIGRACPGVPRRLGGRPAVGSSSFGAGYEWAVQPLLRDRCQAELHRTGEYRSLHHELGCRHQLPGNASPDEATPEDPPGGASQPCRSGRRG